MGLSAIEGIIDMVKIGYNIRLGALRQQSEETQSYAKAIEAAFHLITTAPEMGINSESDVALIDEWAAALSPAEIVWRSHSPLEGDWSMYPSNDEIVKRWLTEERPDYIRDDPSYEPSLSGDDPSTNSRYVKSRADLLRKATAAGIKVAVGAFRVGTPHADLIANGTYDDLIRAVLEGGHYFSVHEYCPGIPGAGDVFPYEALLEPESVKSKMKDDDWPTDASYNLLRHSDHFVLRAREMGLADPQIIVTEAFIDLIPNAVDVLEQLQDKYGIPAYNKDLRGVLAWRMYYADAFPEKSFSDVITQLCKYIEEAVYHPDYIQGVCLFSLNWDEDTPEGHNFLNPFLDNFRKTGLPNLNQSDSILTAPPPKIPSAADTISTRSPEFWAKLKELAIAGSKDDFETETEQEIPNVDISEDSATDAVPIPEQVLAENGQDAVSEETEPVLRASSTIEIPAVAMESMGSRWQQGLFESEGVRVRVAPFTDAEPIGLIMGEINGEQHIGDIQSDGYTWRWVRYIHQGEMLEGYAASAFYEFKRS
jgi:hypothetical protein